MKRRELIRRIEELGGILIRHGGKHDWYQNPETKVAQPVPRHAENRRPLGQTHPQNVAEENSVEP
jgi:mRNA interferase HicA